MYNVSATKPYSHKASSNDSSSWHDSMGRLRCRCTKTMSRLLGIMRLAEPGGAFDFWMEAGEDIYSAEDGEPV